MEAISAFARAKAVMRGQSCGPASAPDYAPQSRKRDFGAPSGLHQTDALSFPKSLAGALLLFACFVVPALHREVGFLRFFIGPMSERIAPPWRLEI